MKCSHPRVVYDGNFKSEYPCGKCPACRRSRTREWANRIIHEMAYHKKSCFLTLTYDDEHLPESLSRRDIQLFLKRLRKSIEPDKIKYFGCGEYGSQFGRPHYHMIIFGLDVKSSVFKLLKTVKDKKYYRMNEWTFGFIDIGTVTYKSAAYVAGYIQKKLDKDDYGDKSPPFQFQSQGIGKFYALDNFKRLSKELSFTMNGAKCSLPRYYRKVLGDKINQADLNDLAEERVNELDEFLEQTGRHTQEERSDYKYAAGIQGEKEIKARDAIKKDRSF